MTSVQQDLKLAARKYSLLNAVLHDGRSDKGAVIGRLMAERADLRSEAKLVSMVVSDIVLEVNQLTLGQQNTALQNEFPDFFLSEVERKKDQSRKESEKAKQLPDLPNARRGEFTTRFPPEPNGFMHIGHAKASILGSEYAKMYDGRFILRFDDTNPSAEKKEYYTAFLDSFEWLGIKPSIIRNSSDDLEKFYSLVEKMLANAKAYVCSCSQETMKENRASGKACDHRSNSPSENLNLWRKMLSKELKKNEATVRFMGDMTSPNTAMRDPVLFRIVDDPHPLLGNKYHVWPTYDFAGPVEDSLDGVTHAMRSKEYELRDEVYHAILNSLNLRNPEIIEFSRLNLQNTTLSKRGLSKLIAQKLVSGWDDPRLPTISGLKRRGFLPQAIRDFILSMGLSKVESQPTWDLLENLNRKILDPIAKRYFFVPDPLKLIVKDAPSVVVNLKYHPDRKEFGERQINLGDSFFIPHSDVEHMGVGSNFRMVEALNARITSIDKDLVRAQYAGEERNPDIPKLQWVSMGDEIPLAVMIPGPLMLEGEFNDNSMEIVNGVVESAGNSIQQGEIVQFPRFGFCRLDSKGIAIRAHK